MLHSFMINIASNYLWIQHEYLLLKELINIYLYTLKLLPKKNILKEERIHNSKGCTLRDPPRT